MQRKIMCLIYSGHPWWRVGSACRDWNDYQPPGSSWVSDTALATNDCINLFGLSIQIFISSNWFYVY